jgi:hypothetical protein
VLGGPAESSSPMSCSPKLPQNGNTKAIIVRLFNSMKLCVHGQSQRASSEQ